VGACTIPSIDTLHVQYVSFRMPQTRLLFFPVQLILDRRTGARFNRLANIRHVDAVRLKVGTPSLVLVLELP
jgi:hypothetical protein